MSCVVDVAYIPGDQVEDEGKDSWQLQSCLHEDKCEVGNDGLPGLEGDALLSTRLLGSIALSMSCMAEAIEQVLAYSPHRW